MATQIDTPQALVKRHCPQRGVIFSCDLRGAGPGLRGIQGIEDVQEEGEEYRLEGRGDDFVSHVMRFISDKEARATATVEP